MKIKIILSRDMIRKMSTDLLLIKILRLSKWRFKVVYLKGA